MSQATALTTAATDTIVANTITHDPIISGLAWVVGIVVLIIAMGKPLRDYVRGEKREDKKDVVVDAKSSAESVLYNHLSDQVSQYRKIADQAFRERNDLIQRVAALEAKAEDLVDAKAVIEQLKIRLDKKDDEIQLLLAQSADERKQFLEILCNKESEISKRDERILSLENRQKELEIRLARDEVANVQHVCPLHAMQKSMEGSQIPFPVDVQEAP